MEAVFHLTEAEKSKAKQFVASQEWNDFWDYYYDYTANGPCFNPDQYFRLSEDFSTLTLIGQRPALAQDGFVWLAQQIVGLRAPDVYNTSDDRLRWYEETYSYMRYRAPFDEFVEWALATNHCGQPRLCREAWANFRPEMAEEAARRERLANLKALAKYKGRQFAARH